MKTPSNEGCVSEECLLQVAGLDVTRGKRKILHGVSCEASRGEVLSLIGANGSGKSTLLKTILRLLPHEAGRIELKQQCVDSYPPRERAKLMSYMAQENECRWPISVRRVVALGRMPHQGPWDRLSEDDEALVEQSMEMAGILELAERNIMHLSGGERRRALFARALASQPELLLADEPTAGLDPYHQLHLMELFREQAKMGRSVIVVLHDLTLASRFSDRIVLLRDGHVLADGKPSEVMSPDILSQAYSIESRCFECGDDRAVIPWNCLHGS